MFYGQAPHIKRHFEDIRPACAFFVDNDALCGLPAVAVYVTDDDRRECRPICQKHRETARHGDGPVFDLVPAVEVHDG